jgi:RNA polymerase sigma-70 factor (ECF subfamily)
MIEEPSETRLWLCRLRDGNHEALAELFDCHRARLERMVQLRLDRRLLGRVDPADVLQEAYLDAAACVQSYLRDPVVNSYIWLRGLVRDRLIRLYRRHLQAGCRTVERECVLPEASSVFLARRIMGERSGPSRALRRAEICDRVQGALKKLEREDREIILMRHFEEMSNGEVAQMLSLSESAASMRYGRAVFRLKQLLLLAMSRP